MGAVLREQNALPYGSWIMTNLTAKAAIDNCRAGRAAKSANPVIRIINFNSTDKKFANHDVCIFVVGDELRITTNLVQGFLHGERDLGCYAFKKEEITLSKHNDGNHLIAELKANKIVFLLGYRAKGFINKFFLQKG